MTPYILLVEDEESISMMLRYNLEAEGFEVELAEDGAEALICADERVPDLIIMDWMIPELSGLEVCKRLRVKEETRLVPIIMLTARGEEADRISGLDSGADDYMTKPFSPKELIARINAVLRRTRPVFAEKRLEYGGVNVNLAGHKVDYKGRSIHLGPTEFRLLTYLMESPKQVFSRTQLLDSVWGRDVFVESRTVDVHIRRLRKALSEVQPGLDNMIKTIRGAGYILDIDDA